MLDVDNTIKMKAKDLQPGDMYYWKDYANFCALVIQKRIENNKIHIIMFEINTHELRSTSCMSTQSLHRELEWIRAK